jgi:hypothetical protein
MGCYLRWLDDFSGAAFIQAVDFAVDVDEDSAGRKQAFPTTGLRRFGTQPVTVRMRYLAPICLVASFAACAPKEEALVSRPYIVPPYATQVALQEWSERCERLFRPARIQRQHCRHARYFYRRDDCAQYFIFKDGKVLSAEGYGAEQECWWVAESCERGEELRPAKRNVWASWTFEEVKACFGKPDHTSHRNLTSPDARLPRSQPRPSIVDYRWNETEAGACKRLLRNARTSRNEVTLWNSCGTAACHRFRRRRLRGEGRADPAHA